MLVAHDLDGNEYIVSNILELKDNFYICPTCNESVFLKYDSFNVPHFVHYESINKHDWEFENYEHRLMKFDVFNYFKNFSWVKDIKFEKVVFKDEKHKHFLIPDIYIETIDDVKIAIECQYAMCKSDKINEKTKEYEKLNIHVLWIFDKKYINNFTRINDYDVTIENKIKCENTFLKNILYNRYYIYNDYKSNHRTWDNHIVDFVKSNLNTIIDETKEDNAVYIKLNHDEMDDFKILNFKLNNYLKASKLPFISVIRGVMSDEHIISDDKNKVLNCEHIFSGNTVLEIKYDKFFDYLKNYDVLFALTNICFRKSKSYGKYTHYNDIILKTFYDKYLNFDKLSDISLDFETLFTDKRNLNESYLFKKIVSKHLPGTLIGEFKHEIKLW